MSNFWLLDEEVKVDGSFDLGAMDFAPMPDGTTVLAAAEDAKWDSYEGDTYISIQWSLLAPKEYANRKIFQKIKVNDADSTKRQKAIKMLMAIDFNAKGGLMEKGSEPTSEDLKKSFVMKPMNLHLKVWEMNGKEGNWVTSVSPKGDKVPSKVIPVERVEIEMTDEDESELAF